LHVEMIGQRFNLVQHMLHSESLFVDVRKATAMVALLFRTETRGREFR